MLNMSKIIRTKFNKEGDMIYISHLDLQQLLQRAFRRAEIDLVHSQGFNPHPKISYGNALALGTESQGEYFDVERMISSDYLSKVTVNKTSLYDEIDRAFTLSKEASFFGGNTSKESVTRSCFRISAIRIKLSWYPSLSASIRIILICLLYENCRHLSFYSLTISNCSFDAFIIPE